jgi:hypothetical protein
MVDGFRIYDSIYCTLWYSAWLHCTVHCYTYTGVHSHVFTALSSESESLYDLWFTANQFILAPSPLRITTRDFLLQLNPCGHSPDRRSASQSVLVSSTHLWPKTRLFLLLDSCGFVDGPPLWREDGCIVYNSCWSPRQRNHSRVRVPRESRLYFTVSDSRLPQPGGPRPRICIPQELGGPVIPPGTGFPFHRHLRLTGLRWRYSTKVKVALWRLYGPAYNISSRSA